MNSRQSQQDPAPNSQKNQISKEYMKRKLLIECENKVLQTTCVMFYGSYVKK